MFFVFYNGSIFFYAVKYVPKPLEYLNFEKKLLLKLCILYFGILLWDSHWDSPNKLVKLTIFGVSLYLSLDFSRFS